MDAVELKKLAEANGLPAISVIITGDEPPVSRFHGTLNEFWTAAKTLGAKAVFMSVMQMDESDFERNVPSDDVQHIEDDDGDESFDGDDYWVSLEKHSSAITKFRKHVGKDCAFILVAKGGVAEIDFLLTEPWWDAFQEEAGKAIEKWRDSRSEKSETAKQTSEKKKAELLRTLRGLINDQEFCQLRTHRAKIAYAIEKHPELAELSDFILRPEIQTLSDRIEAKGLNRKAPMVRKAAEQ